MVDEGDDLVLRLLRDMRTEHTQDRKRLLQIVDVPRKMEQRLETRISAVDQRISALDRRFNELKDDLELLLRSEIMGSQTNFEINFDHRLQEIGERMRTKE